MSYIQHPTQLIKSQDSIIYVGTVSGAARPRVASTGDLIKPDQLHMTVPMHVCTGKVLAEAIAGELGQISAEVISASR
jgi:hypothetical protein